MKYLRIFVINAVVIIQLGAMDEGDVKQSAAREIERKESSAVYDVRLGFISSAAPKRFTAMAFNPCNEQQLVLGDTQGELCYLDLEVGSNVRPAIAFPKITSLAFISDARLLMGNERNISYMSRDNIESAWIHTKLIQLSSKVLAFAFHRRNVVIVSASDDGAYKVWDLQTEKNVRDLVSDAAEPALAVKFLAKDLVAVGAADSSILLFDVRAKEPVKKLTVHTSLVSSLDADEEQQCFVSGSYDSSVVLWDQRMFKVDQQAKVHKDPSPVLSVALVPRSQTWSNYRCLWGTMNGGVFRAEAKAVLGGEHFHTARVTAVAANSRYVASTSYDGTYGLHGIFSKKLLAKTSDKPYAQGDCSVCLESLRNGKPRYALGCFHAFHKKCAQDALSYKKECPVCRAAYDNELIELDALEPEKEQSSSASTQSSGLSKDKLLDGEK